MMLLLWPLLLLLPSPAQPARDGASHPLAGIQRIPRDIEPQPIKVLISEPCTQDDSSDAPQGKEVDLEPGSPLVLTHRIRLVPGPGSSSCSGCEAQFAALRERLERLEREVSALREKCGGPDGGCCTSQQSQGVGCTTVRPQTDGCPDDCNDQGRCEDGKCVCFPGFSGPDCSVSSCPDNCNNKGKCVNGKCVCDSGFTGPDCSSKACPDNCNNKGKCVDGKCVCDPGFTGLDCSLKACPDNCNNKGKCVDGKCVCDPGFTGLDCSLKACPDNCNNKGKCVNGKCVCDRGFTGPDCASKACPDNCSNNGNCFNGRCVCDAGFTGPNCATKTCLNNCNNKGRCVNGQCVCDAGFTGPDCSTKACPNNCNNKGRCVNGKCVCDTGFTGSDCSSKSCPGNCNNKGRCVNGKCLCDTGFTGTDCSSKSCPGNCNNKGRCVNGQCVCDAGFTGPDCSTKACPNNCNNKGRCVNGKCVCDTGFTGTDCSSKSCPGNCNKKGMCVNGKCVCDAGFTGTDCSVKACLNNCNDRGRCVNGKCVCDDGFTGTDCSSKSCPGNCNNRGKCVDGTCMCNTGYTGDDCSTKTCLNNCSDKGKCVNGKCVCDEGFTGTDCSAKSCPGNCNNRGKCVDGTCVCNSGYTGDDCSTKTCLNNCSDKGKCVNGKCVCDDGFAGADCSTKTCPNNCSNKGRCVKGKCICRRGFTGPDCSECEPGLSGPDCSTALTGVSLLSAKDITESSVTLFWTPPTLQYDTYHITFTSKKESDQQITSKISGRLTTYIQTGLAPGQEYMVSVKGEKDGKMGTESTTEFITLIAGPKNLEVVKTSTTYIIVQWEQAQGEVDKYVLSVTPDETNGSGRGKGGQEINLPGERDSAQIDGLEAGRLYHISLIAERDGSQSQPATTEATPGPEPPSDLLFSDVTERSLSLSWTKPNSSVTGFKVTYTHVKEGEPVSIAVGSDDTTTDLSNLSPGSSYEVSVISVRGLDESDPIKDTALTLPDSPTDLEAINVTDTKALLLWRPALATVDRYVINYGPKKDPGAVMTITVSGNAAEQQLRDLTEATEYIVTVLSQLGSLRSTGANATFTTTSGIKEDGPRDLTASQVTPRTAVLSWKPPVSAASSYKLTYSTDGQEVKTVILNGTVSGHKLTRLRSMAKYTVQLQAERAGLYTTAISTEFTTGKLRFPFPTDCSQERQNGIQDSGIVEIFPWGKEGKPVLVYCDLETDGGGWTVFQRRKDGKTDFFRNWRNYSSGFGDLEGEFWLGNELLHNLTKMSPMSLRVDLRSGGESVHAQYSFFSVDTQRKHYTLRLSGYSGTAGDSMSYHSGRPFSTRDRDPRPFITRCAMSYRGGWWYKNCHEANLNGLYDTNTNHQGVIWTEWKGKDTSIAFTEMKFRPTSFNPRS